MTAVRTLTVAAVLALAASAPAQAGVTPRTGTSTETGTSTQAGTAPQTGTPAEAGTPPRQARSGGESADAAGGRPTVCGPGPATVGRANAARDWAPVTPAKWLFPGDQVILAEQGVSRPGPRRPFEYAVLKTGPVFGSAQIDAEVRLDTPTTVGNRDVIIVFGYRSDTEFYYAHLSQDNTIYPHNGIFVVDDADRLRIDEQWNGQVGAPPAVTDENWHRVRVRHCAPTGRIEVFVDGSPVPLMTATDRTFGHGRVGFGSFDNIGRVRDLTVKGTPVCEGRPATLVGTSRRDVLVGTRHPDVIAALAGDDVVHAPGDDTEHPEQ